MTNSLVTNETKMARVTNGKDVPHPIPWQIEIGSKIGGRCGGTIINSQSILTAAHCFDDDALKNDVSNIFIRAGITNANFQNNKQKIFVREIIIHPKFTRNDNQKMDSDIAILTLKQSLSFNDFVQPACLPDHSIDILQLKYGVISGWGKDDGTGNIILD